MEIKLPTNLATIILLEYKSFCNFADIITSVVKTTHNDT